MPARKKFSADEDVADWSFCVWLRSGSLLFVIYSRPSTVPCPGGGDRHMLACVRRCRHACKRHLDEKLPDIIGRVSPLEWPGRSAGLFARVSGLHRGECVVWQSPMPSARFLASFSRTRLDELVRKIVIIVDQIKSSTW